MTAARPNGEARMAVNENTPITVSTANGVTTVFPANFTILSSADLVVVGDLDGVTTIFSEGAHYTVSGVGTGSCDITFLAAPANGTTITRYRVTKLERTEDYQDGGDLLADTVNPDFDRLWYAIQELVAGLSAQPSALRVPYGETVSPLPNAATRAGYYLGFDGSGAPTLLSSPAGSAGSLAADLILSNNAAKGAGMLGFGPKLSYSAGLGRSLADREWNCRDYPWLAKFDGATDDTAAIMSCLSDLYAAGGGTMLMPRGTAKVSSIVFQWAAERSIVIRGQGKDATILQKITGTTTPVIRLYGATNPLIVNSMLKSFSIYGDNTGTHNGLQVEGLAFLHTENLRIRFCNVGLECMGYLSSSHDRIYAVDNKIGVRTRKLSAVYANLLQFRSGSIGSNTSIGVDLGESSGTQFHGVDFEHNGTLGDLTTGAVRIRSTVDDETGFSRTLFKGCWFEANVGRPFVAEDAGGCYLSVESCNFTTGGVDCCTVGAIGAFVWINCEAGGPTSSDTLTLNAARAVLIGGIVYALNDTSTYKTYLGFRTATTVYDNYTNRMFMAGNLYSTASLVHKVLGGVASYSPGSFTEGDHISGFQDRDVIGNLHAFLTTNGVPGNSAVCALRVGASKVSGGTGRSINAGGTVNTLGADYAEYENKRSDCGELAKGAIVGFDAAGLLTDKWSLAETFGIKSTAPSFVGGDTWAAGLTPDPETGRLSDADAAELERRRQQVDRIAYSGKVPANITAEVGDYVIPQAGAGDTITAAGVASPTLAQYLSAIGQVRSIGVDGRPVVAVKVS